MRRQLEQQALASAQQAQQQQQYLLHQRQVQKQQQMLQLEQAQSSHYFHQQKQQQKLQAQQDHLFQQQQHQLHVQQQQQALHYVPYPPSSPKTASIDMYAQPPLPSHQHRHLAAFAPSSGPEQFVLEEDTTPRRDSFVSGTTRTASTGAGDHALWLSGSASPRSAGSRASSPLASGTCFVEQLSADASPLVDGHAAHPSHHAAAATAAAGAGVGLLLGGGFDEGLLSLLPRPTPEQQLLQQLYFAPLSSGGAAGATSSGCGGGNLASSSMFMSPEASTLTLDSAKSPASAFSCEGVSTPAQLRLSDPASVISTSPAPAPASAAATTAIESDRRSRSNSANVSVVAQPGVPMPNETVFVVNRTGQEILFLCTTVNATRAPVRPA